MTHRLHKFNEKYYDLTFNCEITSHGKNIFSLEPYPEMKIENRGKRYYLIGKINHHEINYLAEYLIRFGPNVKNIQPAKLKQKYREILQKISRNI